MVATGFGLQNSLTIPDFPDSFIILSLISSSSKTRPFLIFISKKKLFDFEKLNLSYSYTILPDISQNSLTIPCVSLTK